MHGRAPYGSPPVEKRKDFEPTHRRRSMAPRRYPAGVTEREPVLEAQRWGDDPKLVDLLGERGAAEFRALFDAFPEAVGVLWALRDDDGRIVDFTFGYGNPTILRAFRLPAATPDRCTPLQALPRMRDSRAFAAYVRFIRRRGSSP